MNGIENTDKAKKLFDKVKDDSVKKFLDTLILSIESKAKTIRAVTHEFKFWFSGQQKCCLYIRPSSKRVDIYIADLKPEIVKREALKHELILDVKDNTSNPNDQFKSVIVVDGQWLEANSGKINDLTGFINNLMEDLNKRGMLDK